jgi:ATP-dependent Clp protease ATP-binding subunit ClpA
VPQAGCPSASLTMTFSDEAEGVLQRALVMACEAGHAQITPEHVALELIADDEAATFLVRCGTDLVAVEARLRAHLERLQSNDEPNADARPDAAFERVVEAAIQSADDDDRETVMVRDLFLALIDERGGVASVAIMEATREPEAFEDLRSYGSDES